MQRIDIHDGIESTLVMLAPKLAKVEVDRALGADVPLVRGIRRRVEPGAGRTSSTTPSTR